MRIAYACYWNAFAADGVTAKLAVQLRTWRDAGHEAKLFCLTPSGGGVAPVLEGELFEFAGPAGRLGATRALAAAAGRYAPDVVYLRYDLFVPPPRRLLRRCASAIEINEDDRLELRLRRSRARVYNELNRRALMGSSSGFVCVGHELTRVVAPFGKPTAVIANGIELGGRRVLPPPRSERPTLAFLSGADVPWQGVDKVLDMARACPEWDFHVIGVDPPRWAPTAPPNVRLSPMLSRAEYEAALATADVGIGTLALHRKGTTETSALKVCEYLACGLPIVLGYEDTNLIGHSPWYLLRIPNTESNVRDSLPQIREFVAGVRGRRVERAEVAPLIDARAKEQARLRFLTSLRAGEPARR